jgi:hypothetical protein
MRNRNSPIIAPLGSVKSGSECISMLSWFKKRRDAAQTAEIIAGAQAALDRLGELIEENPGYMDESWLPLPKAGMKLALKILWIASGGNQHRHELVEGGCFSYRRSSRV